MTLVTLVVESLPQGCGHVSATTETLAASVFASLTYRSGRESVTLVTLVTLVTQDFQRLAQWPSLDSAIKPKA